MSLHQRPNPATLDFAYTIAMESGPQSSLVSVGSIPFRVGYFTLLSFLAMYDDLHAALYSFVFSSSSSRSSITLPA